MGGTEPGKVKKTCDVSTTHFDSFALDNCHDSNGVKLGGSKWAYSGTCYLRWTFTMGISSYSSGNSSYVNTFAEGMHLDNTINIVLVKCRPNESKAHCDFNPDNVRSQLIQKPIMPMISNIKLADCSRCDVASSKCETCECGSGADCVPND